jgi:hypothetical protein
MASNAGLLELPLMPELEGERNRIDFVGLPPSRLAAVSVELAVVEATERNSELVANPATEGARLGKAQMVRIGRGLNGEAGHRHQLPAPYSLFFANLSGSA